LINSEYILFFRAPLPAVRCMPRVRTGHGAMPLPSGALVTINGHHRKQKSPGKTRAFLHLRQILPIYHLTIIWKKNAFNLVVNTWLV